MNDEDFMRLAITEAKKSKQPVKCGCIIVKDGQILAKSSNSQRDDHDSIAHAEIKALHEAGKKYGREKIKQGTAYCTCEPCLMCLAALNTSGITQIYFGVPLKDLSDLSNRIDIDINNFSKHSPWKFEYFPNFLHVECLTELYS